MILISYIALKPAEVTKYYALFSVDGWAYKSGPFVVLKFKSQDDVG